MKHVILKARLVLESNNKVLLLAQTTENGGKFTLVGGTVKSKEFIKTTLIRECFEEIKIKISSDDLSLIHVLHKKIRKEDRITLYFTTEKWEGTIKAMEPDKFKGVKWFSKYNLPAKTSPTVRHVIQQIILGKKYSELTK